MRVVDGDAKRGHAHEPLKPQKQRVTERAELQRGAGERLAAPIGFATYAIGAVLWLVAMALRMSVQTWAARESMVGEVPSFYLACHTLGGVLHAAHMMLSYVSVIILGAGILSSGSLSIAAGWAGIVGGAVFAAGFVLARGGLFGMPFLAHVYTCFIGVLLLRSGHRP